MFRRRDLPSLLFLLTLITMLLMTLCQILVVHRYELHMQSEKETNKKPKPKTLQNNSVMTRKYKEMHAVISFRKSKILARTEVFRRQIANLIMESKSNDSLNPKTQRVVQRTRYGTESRTNVGIHGRRFLAEDMKTERKWYDVISLKGTKDICSLVPPFLYGNRTNQKFKFKNFTMKDITLQNSDMEKGGTWKPAHCTSRHKVAIVIPYRNRFRHLVTLLAFLLPILKRQLLHFRIFVAEQYGDDIFNKGRLMNAAFLEARKLFDFHCVVFHDVDLVPEDDRNMYTCPWQPKHLSVAIDEMNYKLKYELLVGGVLNMRKEHFVLVNGYSNNYWGWGGEDDDMAYRILLSGLRITRPPSSIARYSMLRHRKRSPSVWTDRNKLLKTVNTRFQNDGIINVPYTKIFTHDEHLFTHFMLDVGKPPVDTSSRTV